jgi:two-component system CheB/CheR fusion protein
MLGELIGNDIIDLQLLLNKVYCNGNYDFRDYKSGTVVRRLTRRLYATGTANYPEYINYLDNHPEEYEKLADDITIKVSGFFRSPYAFEQITALILPEMIARHEAAGDNRIRIWSSACACGEEPYSIAILLSEFLGERRNDFDITIYATDISKWALERAKKGEYTNRELEGFPEYLREKYFSRQNGHFSIREDIRQMVSFFRHDLTSRKTAPVKNLDCIFCCNVFIYWQKPLQERVILGLYDALEATGHLVMGEAEAPPANVRNKFMCMDNQAKIYIKQSNTNTVAEEVEIWSKTCPR